MRPVATVLEGLTFLESPRWHDGRVWVSDFYTGQVLSARADGSDRRLEAFVPAQPSGLGWLPDGRLLIVSMLDARLLRREHDGSLLTHADLRPFVNGPPNDMVVDRVGRAYVGEFGFDLMGGAGVAPARLLRVDPDGAVAPVAGDLWFPNGSVISEDPARLIVTETFGNRVSVFGIAADGTLGARRDWATFGPPPSSADVRTTMREAARAPDGCTADAEGLLWVADALTGRVTRLREGGEEVEEVGGGVHAFACTLGGLDGRTLYMCAAPDSVEKRRRAECAARLLAVRVAVGHAGLP